MQPKVKNLQKQLQDGSHKTRITRIYNYIKSQRLTNIHEMRIALNIPHQSLTSSISSLLDTGMIKSFKEIKINNLFYTQYMASDVDEINSLAYEREMQKFKMWLIHGYKNYCRHFTNDFILEIGHLLKIANGK